MRVVTTRGLDFIGAHVEDAYLALAHHAMMIDSEVVVVLGSLTLGTRHQLLVACIRVGVLPSVLSPTRLLC